MLINAELLLQYQRCRRRPFLDIHGDHTQRSEPTDLLVKLQQDKIIHQKGILRRIQHTRPRYRWGDWRVGAVETLELMRQGVDCIYQGVMLADYADIEWRTYLQVSNSLEEVFDTELSAVAVAALDSNNDNVYTLPVLIEASFSNYTAPLFSPFIPNHRYTLVSCPDLLIKQPGKSRFGDWTYIPTTIELGKRPKQEYQVIAAYHAELLKMTQGVEPATACLMLRSKETSYNVDLRRWTVQMQRILTNCVESLEAETAPDIFISRQKCTLCHWYNDCYQVARASHHLSLLPGVTPVRYAQLQALNIRTPESLANTNPVDLENLPGFDSYIAPKLVIQAQSITENRALLLPDSIRKVDEDDAVLKSAYTYTSLSSLRQSQIAVKDVRQNYPVELYFDIEAQPDLNLNYLLGVLVIDKVAKTEQFYSFMAEKPEDEGLVWQQFVDLVNQYPEAPIYHFCVYEFDTVKRLAKLYRTQYDVVLPILSRFVDIYEELIKSVTLPIESYALKVIAKWLGFEWRDSDASGAKCIYWYDQWLKTGNRAMLSIIQRYNEDDCRATRCVKDWLFNFFESNSLKKHV